MANISGTTGDDFPLLDTDGDDVIDALAGDDFVLASGGNDTLIGGPGDDVLVGGVGNDVFQYSFDLSVSSSGGTGTTYKFTDWLSEKYGKDFGDALPDCAPDHHHKHNHHKHDKNEKHDKHAEHNKHEKHEQHAKHDKHEKHGKDDKHHSKDDDHGNHHKHSANDGHDAQELCLTQGFFAKNYSEWLRDVVVADLLAQGLVEDVNGNGRIDVKLSQNDPLGTPLIEGLSAEELAGMFSGRDGVTLKTGKHTHERFYSNEFTSESGGGETTGSVTSGDGFDTIADFDATNVFGLGLDKIRFDFTADANWGDPFVVAGDDVATKAAELAFLEDLFSISQVDAFGIGGVNSTRIQLASEFQTPVNDPLDDTWSVTLEATLLTDAEVFAALDIYVNGDLIG